MKDKGIVVKIEKGKNEEDSCVTVVPVITDACISCTSPCGKRGNPFVVSNRQNFDIKEGSVVKIGASKTVQAVQGLIALLFPVVAAVCGYVFCPVILKNPDVSEGKRAAFVLAFLALSSIFVFIFSRNNKHIIKSEILDVYYR